MKEAFVAGLILGGMAIMLYIVAGQMQSHEMFMMWQKAALSFHVAAIIPLSINAICCLQKLKERWSKDE